MYGCEAQLRFFWYVTKVYRRIVDDNIKKRGNVRIDIDPPKW